MPGGQVATAGSGRIGERRPFVCPERRSDQLPEYCLRLHGLTRTRIALDPFLGLGSTAVAAASLDVDFVGIEVDESYLAEAVARTRAALEQLRTGRRRTRSAR